MADGTATQLESTSSVGNESTKKASDLGVGSLCSIVDRDPDLKTCSITYISNDRVVPIRGSDLQLQNHAIITPYGEESPSGTRLRDGMIDAGIDCGLAGAGLVAATSTCGGTVVTLGAAAPLCVVSSIAVATSTWQCANSIGRVINDGVIGDFSLNDSVDADDHWFKKFNRTVGSIDKLASILTMKAGFSKASKLQKVASKHKGNFGTKYTRKESREAYREVAEATGETLSNQGVKRWINGRGYSHQFSSKVISQEMHSVLKGLSLDAATLGSGGLKKGAKVVGDAKAESDRRIEERMRYAPNRPRHVMHIMQQAKP